MVLLIRNRFGYSHPLSHCISFSYHFTFLFFLSRALCSLYKKESSKLKCHYVKVSVLVVILWQLFSSYFQTPVRPATLPQLANISRLHNNLTGLQYVFFIYFSLLKPLRACTEPLIRCNSLQPVTNFSDASWGVLVHGTNQKIVISVAR